MNRDFQWLPEKTRSKLDTVRKHQLDVALVSLVYNRLPTKSSLLLCFFLCQDVILEGALALDLTGTGHLEPFFGS